VEVTQKNGVYFLAGRIDEFSEFEVFAAAPSPLVLNLGKVRSINSIGVRKFLAFAMKWVPKKFEFHECTPEFLANLNVIPQLLGAPGDVGQIRSFYVPFACEPCKRVENVLFQSDQIGSDAKGEVTLPKRSCARCGEELSLDVEKSEYFVFLMSGKAFKA
jgi:hypothetical protein